MDHTTRRSAPRPGRAAPEEGTFFVFARRFAALKQRGWMVATLFVGVAVLVLGSPLTMGGDLDNPSFLGLWAALILGWSWLSLLAARIRAGRLDMSQGQPSPGRVG